MSTTTIPMPASVRLMLDTYDACISFLQDRRESELKFSRERPERITERLAEPMLLHQILMDWGGGGFWDDFPAESHLVSAILGNLSLPKQTAEPAATAPAGIQ